MLQQHQARAYFLQHCFSGASFNRGSRVQAGIQAAAGVLLGASAVAGVMAIFLPIETMGRSLPEDAEEIQEMAILDRRGKGTTQAEGNGGGMSDAAVARAPETASEANPFHVSELDAPPEPIEAEQEQS